MPFLTCGTEDTAVFVHCRWSLSNSFECINVWFTFPVCTHIQRWCPTWLKEFFELVSMPGIVTEVFVYFYI